MPVTTKYTISGNSVKETAGVVTPGYIYNESSGVKADYYWYYRFTLSKGVFKGTSRGGDEGKHTVDSILVVYLSSDPTINRSLAFLE